MDDIEDRPSAGSNADTQLVENAGPPFDHTDADVIIRSSDNVDFRVFKLLLLLGSPFFRDMFALPQASEGDPSGETKDGLPVVQVTEGRKVLEMLLSSCYPMDPPPLDQLEDVESLLKVAIKYSVERAEKRAREMLVETRFLRANPVRVFAIACRYKMEEEARLAARATLSESLTEEACGPELEFITAGKLFKLLQCHLRSVTAARNATIDFPWPGVSENSSQWPSCNECNVQLQSILPDAIFTALLSRVPDKKEIKTAMEKEGYLLTTCSNCSAGNSLYREATTCKMVRESASSFRAKMESAVSSVSIVLQA